MKVEIDAKLVRAAMACAGKRDVRYYINGVYLATNGDIVGTNGHVMFKGQYDIEDQEPLKKGVILKIHGTIPAGAKKVTFDIPEDGVTRGFCFTDNDKAFLFDIIDGKYPAYEKVIPKPNRKSFTNTIGIQPQYFSLIEKVFGKGVYVVLSHGLANESAIVTCGRLEQAVLVLMPCHLGKDIETTSHIEEQPESAESKVA